jgi:uncharacterized membrane protein YgaE (UPF0421/DUF939 family)
MSKGIFAIIGAISALVIIYFLLGLGDSSTETQTLTQNEVKTVSEKTQIQNNTDTPDTTEQELENELNKIEENLDMELSEEIQ